MKKNKLFDVKTNGRVQIRIINPGPDHCQPASFMRKVLSKPFPLAK